jgi:hypothetical protein
MSITISWGDSGSGATIRLPFQDNSTLSSNVIITNPGSDDDVALDANQFPVTSETISLYRMNESSWSGTRSEVRDSSRKRHHGVAIGGASTGVGWEGQAGLFDGNVKRASLPHHSDFELHGEYFLIEAVIKRLGNGTSTSEHLVHKEKLDGPYGGYSWYIDRTTKRMRFRIIDDHGNISLYTSSTLSALGNNTWTHVWVFYDSNTPYGITFGIDDEVETVLPVGIDIGRVPIVTPTVNAESYPQSVSIGGKNIDGDGFNGYIDELRFLVVPTGGSDDISYSVGTNFPRYSAGNLFVNADVPQESTITGVEAICPQIGTGYGTVTLYANGTPIGTGPYSSSPITITGLTVDAPIDVKAPLIKAVFTPDDATATNTDAPTMSNIEVTIDPPDIASYPAGPLLFPGGFWGNSMLVLYSPKTDDHPSVEVTDGIAANCVYCTEFDLYPAQEADTGDGLIDGHPDRLAWSPSGIEIKGRMSQKMLAMNDGSPDYVMAKLYEHCRHAWAGYQYAFPADYGGGVQGIDPSVYVPQFSIFSDVHGVFSNCQIDSIEMVAEPNEQVVVNYDVVAQKLWPEDARDVRDLFSTVALDAGRYGLMRQVFSHDCGITAAGNDGDPVRSAFDLPSSGSNVLLGGYNMPTTPPNERLARMTLKIENFMEPIFTMQSHQRWSTAEERDEHAYERFRENMWPRSWYNSKPRLISGELVWITDTFPMEIFSRVVGIPDNQIFAPIEGTQLGQTILMAFGPLWIRITNPVWSVPKPEIRPDKMFSLTARFVGASDGDLILLPTEDWTRDILDARPVYIEDPPDSDLYEQKYPWEA